MTENVSGPHTDSAFRTGQAHLPIREISNVPLGAAYLGEGLCSFCVWAPAVTTVEVCLGATQARREKMVCEKGYHWTVLPDVRPGTPYLYRLGSGPLRPDPASRYQPETVHGLSAVVDPKFAWTDEAWRGMAFSDFVLYEIHVGTFTPQGTFDGAIERLPELRELGVTAIEIMPVSQFPGSRNWGYDGVLPFAVQNSYGGPDSFKRLIAAAHRQSLAVILDVVYNHFGPEGNYLREFGPYYTDTYKIPWGDAVNFDGEYSDEVRRFFLENARYWQKDFHLDGLRLDAVHAMRDSSAMPFLQELARSAKAEAERSGRPFYLIAESDLNDPRIIRTEALGGFGLHAQWSDDFHHCLHVLLTEEQSGYYQDFGGVRQMAKVFREGYAYTGQYSPFRKRRHGHQATGTAPCQFIVCSQNHDQIGNRCAGDRLASFLPFEKLKMAAAGVVLSPFIPMLFMGEEYGERAPFQYFVSHEDPSLIEAVRRGRRREFAGFNWADEAPDPFDVSTFDRCKCQWPRSGVDHQPRKLREFYRELLRMRRMIGLHRYPNPVATEAQSQGDSLLLVCYSDASSRFWVLFNFAPTAEELFLERDCSRSTVLLSSAEVRWGGSIGAAPQIRSRGKKLLIELPPTCVVVLGAPDAPKMGW
jgi:maltooligosyltrehalose trehalohydrolase